MPHLLGRPLAEDPARVVAVFHSHVRGTAGRDARTFAELSLQLLRELKDGGVEVAGTLAPKTRTLTNTKAWFWLGRRNRLKSKK